MKKTVKKPHSLYVWRVHALLLVLMSFVGITATVFASGVTIITHGLQPFLGYPAWVDRMAQATIHAASQRGLSTTWYHIYIYKNGSSIVSTVIRKPASSSTPQSEIVVTVDWSVLSNHLLSGGVTTDQVAYELAKVLRTPDPAIGLTLPLTAKPLHLIGHSRGGSVMLETAHLLGKSGIWVDHLTTLDPHPLVYPDAGIIRDGPIEPDRIFPPDPPVRLYDNVVFADNYWREDPNWVAWTLGSLDFNGQSISSTHDFELNESILSGLGSLTEHSDVHTWYYGTVGPPYPELDGEIYISDDWYAGEYSRDENGFAFSRLDPNGVTRRGQFPKGIAANHGGTGSRFTPDQGGGAQWANVGDIQLPPYPLNRIPQGQAFNATYRYQDRDSALLIEWLADTDINPLNGTGASLASQNLASTGGAVASGSVSIPTSGLNAVVQRQLLAKITSVNNGAVRYEYGNSMFTVTWPEFVLNSVAPVQVVAGNGATTLTLQGSGFTNTGKIIFSNGGTTIQVTPTVITASQITVAFSFGSTAKTWNLLVRQFVDGIPFRDSEPLSIQVSASPPVGPTVTASAGPNGSISPSGTFSRNVGSSVTFNATAITGYEVASWYVNGAVAQSGGATYTIASFQANTAVQVTFRQTATTPLTGDLLVNVTPQAAVNGGAQWRFISPVTSNYQPPNVPLQYLGPGQYQISFKSVGGYIKPPDQTVNVVAGETAIINANYTVDTPTTYTLNLSASHGHITPRPDLNVYPAGTEVRLTAYPDDGYVFDHWSGDASGDDRTIYITMTRNKSVTADFDLDTSIGHIRVNLAPPQAVAEGAQWKYRSYTAWQNSGYLLDYIPTGDGYVHFKDIPGWTTPDEIESTVVGGQTTTVNASYQEIPGAVQVTIEPAAANTAGARWRLDGASAWQNSLANLSGVTPGVHQIEFQSVPGWTTPAPQSITVQRGGNAIAFGHYGPLPGQPVIMAVSPPMGPLAGGTALTIDGANFVAPVSVLIGDKPATNVTLLSASQIVCFTPSNSVFGSVPVVVQTVSGSSTNQNGFTYGVTRGTNIQLVASAGGRIDAVAVNGSFAYVGEGSSFVVLDVSNPASPFPVGRRPLPSVVSDIAVFTQSGQTYACVATGDSGLYVVDVTNPVEPALKGYYKTPGFCYGVAVLGGFAYVADGSGGLKIFDLANPSAPALRSSVPQAGFANEIVVKATTNGVFAYLSAGSEGLQIVEVSNPQAPVVRGHVAFGKNTSSIEVAGNRAYLAVPGSSTQRADISNPDLPTDLGQFDSGFAYAVVIQGTTLYSAGSAGFRVQNLSTGTPQVIGNASLVSHGINMTVTNNHAYIAGGDFGLIIVSVNTLSSPVLTGSYAVGLGNYQGVAIDGQYAYTARGNGGFAVFDVSNPALTHVVNQLPNTGATAVMVSNGSAYVLGGNQIRIYSISSPSSPALLGAFPSSVMFCEGMNAFGNNLLVSGQNIENFHTEFAVVNVSTPSSPSLYSKVELSSSREAAFLVANNGVRACVSIQELREVKILDINQLNNPIQIGQIQDLGYVASLAITTDGQTLFVGNYDPELCLRIFNISTPSAPVLISSNYIGGIIRGITLAPGKAHLAAGALGVILMDVENPAIPRILRSYDTPGFAQQIVLSGDYLYVADSAAGLVVLKLTDIERPEIYITNPTFTSVVTNLTGALSIGGSAADNKGVTHLTWANSRGGGGDAAGNSSWLVSGIALQPGTNVLTVTAFDLAGNSSNATLTVIYQSPKQDQTITFPTLADKSFGDAPFTVTAASSSGLPIAFTIFSGPATMSNNIVTLTGAGVVTVRAEQSGDANFNAALAVDRSFTVSKAEQLIALTAPEDVTFGDPPLILNATASSGLPLIFEIVSGPATITGNIMTLTGVGTVSVRAMQMGNESFNPALEVERSFTVAKTHQFITFGVLSRQVLGDAPFPLTASASSALPVSFTVLAGPAVVSGNVLTITGAGLVVLRASQGGNDTYAPAANVDQVLSVAPGNNVITDAQQLENGMFTLRFYGEPGASCVVQVSINLVNWQPIATNQISGLGYLEFTDTASPNHDRRFYRIAP